MQNPTLVAVAGLGGAIGTTLTVGVAASPVTPNTTLGMVTESPRVRALNIPLPSLSSLMITGWDLDTRDVYSAATKLRICPDELLRATRSRTEPIIPRKGITNSDQPADWIRQEAKELKNLAIQLEAKTIVILNLCPTEPHSLQSDDSDLDWASLQGRSDQQLAFSPSRLYFRLAIEVGAHFINFTPNNCFTEGLRRLASTKQLLYCGSDAKTGQTYIKTVLAPAMRDRNLQIEGWYSLNLLGNEDGRNLSDEGTSLTKTLSKAECLEQILGYTPSCNGYKSHHIHIHHYTPRGDNKEAWDNIDIVGFLGQKMQLKVNWLGRDSILAAPMAIDLIRIMAVLDESPLSGPVEELAFFFKSPLTRSSRAVIHDAADQFHLLISLLTSLKSHHWEAVT